jgi:hypothetical protein
MKRRWCSSNNSRYTHSYLIPCVRTLGDAYEAWLVWAEREQGTAVYFELVRIDIFAPMDWLLGTGELTYKTAQEGLLDPRIQFVAMYNRVPRAHNPASSGSSPELGDEEGPSPRETTPLMPPPRR